MPDIADRMDKIYVPGIDKTEETTYATKFSATVGSGGVTAGRCVKWDASNSNTVIQCTAATDDVIGIAQSTVSANGVVLVLGDGCRVRTSESLGTGGRCGVAATTGKVENYSTGSTIGSAITAGGDIRIHIQW